MAYLQNHYRSNVDFSPQVFQRCRKRLLYFYETLALCDAKAGATVAPSEHKLRCYQQAFHQAMQDDFNTSEALAQLHQLARKTNQQLAGKVSPAQQEVAAVCRAVLTDAGQVLGLLRQDAGQFIEALRLKIVAELGLEVQAIEALVAERSAARAARDWAQSDALRDKLASMGIQVKDGSDETTWTILTDS